MLFLSRVANLIPKKLSVSLQITIGVMLVLTSCSKEPEMLEAQFSAQVTVADSVDQTSDFSGFEFLIFNRITINDPIDTLFFARTDTSGRIEGDIQFSQPGAFPVQISRNGRNVASLRLLLADKDTINFKGEFPALDQTLEIDSRENRAMRVYERVDNGFQRVNAFIQAGRFENEEIPAELQKWTDLYWEVYETEKGTFASKFALESALNLLNKFDREQMFVRLNTAFDEEYSFGLASTIGKQYLADTKGFRATVSYLDSVKTLAENKEIERALDQSLIKIHLDSLHVEQARTLLTRYERTYEDDENYSFWYKNLRFELYDLAPGTPIPSFEFESSEGDTINNERLTGSPYILEFTLMANTLYQQQYDESTVIYQLYAPEGLKYFTIPFDVSANTIIAFFEERDRFWPIANPPSFDKKQLVEKFNIQYYPTRILVDAEGNMVRKYIGEEFDGIIPGITETLKK